MSRSVADANRSRYQSPDVVAFYEGRSDLFPAEARAFARHVPAGSRLLDIGVGAGRTTRWLESRCRYVGIDWSPEMVAAAQQAYPGADIRVGDATALEFSDESFDVVVFSFNGIDYVSAPNRQREYAEINRVLTPNGTLIFSSHNPRWIANGPVARSPRVLIGWWRRLPGAAYHSATTARFRRGHGSFFDPEHGGFEVYSASPRRVEDELNANGFELLSVSPSGKRFGFTECWFYYVARKLPPSSSSQPVPPAPI